MLRRAEDAPETTFAQYRSTKQEVDNRLGDSVMEDLRVQSRSRHPHCSITLSTAYALAGHVSFVQDRADAGVFPHLPAVILNGILYVMHLTRCADECAKSD